MHIYMVLINLVIYLFAPNLTTLTVSPTTGAKLLNGSEKRILNFVQSIMVAQFTV